MTVILWALLQLPAATRLLIVFIQMEHAWHRAVPDYITRYTINALEIHMIHPGRIHVTMQADISRTPEATGALHIVDATSTGLVRQAIRNCQQVRDSAWGCHLPNIAAVLYVQEAHQTT